MTKLLLSSRQMLFVCCIAAVGILLRCVELDRSYWFDELATLVNIDGADWATVLRFTALDKQPPLYNSTLFFWTKAFGRSEVAVRALSLLYGLLTLLTPWLARTALNRPERCVCFALLCVMSLPIRYAQEARNYSLLLLLSSACLFYYYEILSARKAYFGNGWIYVALTLLALSHLFGLLLAACFVLVMFYTARRLRQRLFLVLFGLTVCAMVLIPLILGGAAEAAGGNFWITFTAASLSMQILTVFTPVGLGLLAYAVATWRRGTATVVFDPLLIQALAPFVLMFLGAIVISLHTPILTDRNLIGLIPAYVLLVARLLQRLQTRQAWTMPLILVFMMLVQSAALMVAGILFIREDFRRIAQIAVSTNTRVCYVVPTVDVVLWRPLMAYYVSNIFQRPDLDPWTLSIDDAQSSAIGRRCTLWADGHPDAEGSVLTRSGKFKQCSQVPLAKLGARTSSLLLSCPQQGRAAGSS